MKNVYHDQAYAETVDQLKIKLQALRIKYRDSVELDQKYIELYTSQ